MNCPFCGAEMREGALVIRNFRPDENALRWALPLQAPAGGEKGALQRLRDKLVNENWDSETEVPLEGEFDERLAVNTLLNGDRYLKNTWYCPDCEKALCVLERRKGEPGGIFEDEYKSQPLDPAPPQAPAAPLPPPPKKPGPKDDPWEEQGLFRRKRKPDWEK